MTRTLTCSVLIVLSIFLFWYSFSGMNAPFICSWRPSCKSRERIVKSAK